MLVRLPLPQAAGFLLFFLNTMSASRLPHHPPQQRHPDRPDAPSSSAAPTSAPKRPPLVPIKALVSCSASTSWGSDQFFIPSFADSLASTSTAGTSFQGSFHSSKRKFIPDADGLGCLDQKTQRQRTGNPAPASHFPSWKAAPVSPEIPASAHRASAGLVPGPRRALDHVTRAQAAPFAASLGAPHVRSDVPSGSLRARDDLSIAALWGQSCERPNGPRVPPGRRTKSMPRRSLIFSGGTRAHVSTALVASTVRAHETAQASTLHYGLGMRTSQYELYIDISLRVRQRGVEYVRALARAAPTPTAGGQGEWRYFSIWPDMPPVQLLVSPGRVCAPGAGPERQDGAAGARDGADYLQSCACASPGSLSPDASPSSTRSPPSGVMYALHDLGHGLRHCSHLLPCVALLERAWTEWVWSGIT